MTMTDVYYEPWDPSCRVGLFETYQRLILEAPVYQAPSGTWVVSSYAGVDYILSRPELFSNRPNQDETIGFPPKLDVTSSDGEELLQRLMAVAAELPLNFDELLTARVIVGADAPQHTRQRRIVNRGFTPRRVAALQSRIDEIVMSRLEGIENTTSFDILEDLAIPVPVGVIADLLSVEESRHSDVRRWSDLLATLPSSENRGSTESTFALLGMLKEFADYFVPLIEARRAEPQDDMISDLVRAVELDTMTVTETVLFILVVMSAGNETTTNLIGNTVIQLLQNPAQLALLTANPEMMTGAIEESARHQSPFQFLFREAIEDVEVCGVTIPAGGIVAILIGAANRDPDVFQDPDVFDITRETPHLGFGKGIHFCLGAPLARLEAQRALGALLPHLHRFRLSDEPLELNDSLLIRGHRSVLLEAR
jgi:cytochrome P450